MSTVRALTSDGRTLIQSAAQRRAELARDIVSAAHLRGDFILSSGNPSTYYFDKYLFETKPTILRRVAASLAEKVPLNVDRLAGPELGAVPLVTALSLETGIPFVIVRKVSKGYGTSKLVEGEIHPGERILVVEDVVSLGGQALNTAERIRLAGAQVVRVLTVVDREQGGAENIAAAGYHLESLFRLSELPV